jgi:hypothetical protein
MSPKKGPHRETGSTVANAPVSDAQASMSKFRSLATRLLGVSREELNKQQEQFDAKNAARRQKQPHGSNDG